SPRDLFTEGDSVKVKVISIEGDKISLSIKALKPDPWKLIKFQKGDIVQGRVTKLNKFGAFVQIVDDSSPEVSGKIYGLAHVSEFGSHQNMRQKAEIGKIYPFQIAVFQPDLHKLSLIFLGDETENQAKKPEEKEAEEPKTVEK
ncbi:S1 RNA-binding domain-containing protein, partial [Patescibacteria group bacterium]